MVTNLQIIPTILATSEAQYLEKLKKVEDSSLFINEWVQIDLMDNKFVQNKSISPSVIAKYPTDFKKEIHLMVEDLDSWIDELLPGGVGRIIFPVEVAVGIDERIIRLKNQGLEVGLAVNPETPLAKVSEFVDKIDVLLLLSVHPGFGGQDFLPESLEKIREAVKLKDRNEQLIIEVDGGINETNIKDVAEAGADSVAIGEHLINGDITENLEKIWQTLKS